MWLGRRVKLDGTAMKRRVSSAGITPVHKRTAQREGRGVLALLLALLAGRCGSLLESLNDMKQK